MGDVTALVIGLVAGLLAGAVPVLLVLRSRVRAERVTAAAGAQAEVAALQQRSQAAETELRQVRGEIDTCRQRAAGAGEKCAAAESARDQLLRRIDELKAEARTAGDLMQDLRSKLSGREADLSAMQTRLDAERRQAEEKLKLLTEAREQLKTEFQNLANLIFDEKGRTFSEQNKTNLDLILKPLKEQLAQFRQRVDDTHVEEVKGREQLLERIKTLTELNKLVGEEAQNLTTAIKGEAKVQGNWGEMILERALELSGLKKGEQYERQVHATDAEGNSLYPDVVVHLPENRDIVVDSKVSLTGYERYVSAGDDEGRGEALAAHVASVRKHVDELAGKPYTNLPGIKSLDFVLMFVPIEPAFVAAVNAEPDLFKYAFDRRVILISPTTLLVTLRTIESMWRGEQRNRNAVEIARRAGDLYDKFVTFADTLAKVQKAIDSASEECANAARLLTSGRGNIVKRIEDLRKMGLASRKGLARQMLEDAGADDGDDEETGAQG